MLNPCRRSLRWPAALGAGLVTGTEKVRCGYGNGDALLLDFRHRIFAVADAGERFPQASRRLLMRLAAALECHGAPENGMDFHTLIDRVWSRQKYIHKTTLSCIAMVNRQDGPAVMVAHNGDSSITILAPDGRTVLFQTAPDMNFAGRGQAPNPVITHRLGTLRPTIVLATDGLAHIGPLPPPILTGRPQQIGDWMNRQTHGDAGGREYDDIAAIALVPDALFAAREDTIIMGGTLPGEETAFRQARKRGTIPDRWEPIAAWQRLPDWLALAGIRSACQERQ